MIVGYTLFDWNFKRLFYFLYLLSLACLASVGLFHYFALTPAICASLLGLSVHAGAQLHKFLDDSLAFAFCAFLYIFTSFSIAFLAVSVPLNFDIFHSANVHIIECDLNFNKLRFGLSGSSISLASSTKEAAKDISHSTASRWSTVLNTFLAVFIIQLSLFGVG